MLLGAWVCVVVSFPDDLIAQRGDPQSIRDARSAFERRQAARAAPADLARAAILLADDSELEDPPALPSIKSAIVRIAVAGFDYTYERAHHTHITIDPLVRGANEHAPRAPPHWL